MMMRCENWCCSYWTIRMQAMSSNIPAVCEKFDGGSLVKGKAVEYGSCMRISLHMA